MKKILFGILILGGFCGSVFAAPSLGGPTGLIDIPTAQSLKYKEIDFTLDCNLRDTITQNTSEYSYKINLGTFKNWELGVIGGSTPTEGVYINAKYYLMSDDERYPLSLAIGLTNLASKTDTSLYFVATKKFQGGFTGTLGFSYEVSHDPFFIAGFEYFLTNQLSVLADITTPKTQDKKTLINSGIRIYVFEDLHVRLSVLDMTPIHSTYYSVGLSYSKFL